MLAFFMGSVLLPGNLSITSVGELEEAACPRRLLAVQTSSHHQSVSLAPLRHPKTVERPEHNARRA